MVKSREIIAELEERAKESRDALQAEGDRLDELTGGHWLAEALQRTSFSDDAFVVVDAVRILPQVEAIRERFGRVVTHIHLTAPTEILAERYHARPRKFREFDSYAEASANKTEAQVESLADYCDVLIDTSRSTKEDVLVRAAARIGLYQFSVGACVDVVIGGEYGSEGKGNVASYLAPEYQYLVRVGGPNAGHKVIAPPYTFRLLPSGTLRAPHAQLLIGPGATLQVDTLLREVEECKAADRLSIDPQAMIIEPSDIETERTLRKSLASTGQGGGFAAARRLMRGDLPDAAPVRLAKDVEELRPFIRPIVDRLERAYAEGAHVMLEGTQGVGLSLYHGRYKYVTSRDTTASGTMAEAGIAPARIRRVVMVCRSYPIRVGDPPQGTSGFLAQPTDWDTIASRAGLDAEAVKEAEHGSVTGTQRRVGEFEWALFRKACTLNAPTDIAFTFADYLKASNQDARRFEQLDDGTIRFIEELERVASAPVSLISTRFHERSIIDRRMW